MKKPIRHIKVNPASIPTQIKQGQHLSVATEFKKGQHWRKPQAFREKAWLIENYLNQKRSSGEICCEFGVTEEAVCFWLKRHGIPRRTMSEVRKIKRWGVSGENNPMWGRFGDKSSNWKGGCTTERQAFYASKEWKSACCIVWKRDGQTCQKCGDKSEYPHKKVEMHVHHIVSFKNKELRASPDNLILLCDPCHHWVHSKNNTDGDFIKKD